MRIYGNETNGECTSVVCNRCAKEMEIQNDMLKEDVLRVEKVWGYFSGRDGMKQVWDLCEDCYIEFTDSFHLPVEEVEVVEYM